jgi:hypothetical protein
MTYKRFGAPERYIPQPRPKAPGLGSNDSEEIPQDRGRERLEEPHRFTGIRSRSRFMPEPLPPALGHGHAVAIVPLPTLPEPNTRTQFESQDAPTQPGPIGRMPARAEYMASLGQDDGILVRLGKLLFVRRRDPGAVSPPGGGITRATDLIRWSDFGPIDGRINRRFTLRPEFMQNAQTLLGVRLVQARKSNASTAPVSMLPPRVSRLTDRRLPASFGATTETVGE